MEPFRRSKIFSFLHKSPLKAQKIYFVSRLWKIKTNCRNIYNDIKKSNNKDCNKTKSWFTCCQINPNISLFSLRNISRNLNSNVHKIPLPISIQSAIPSINFSVANFCLISFFISCRSKSILVSIGHCAHQKWEKWGRPLLGQSQRYFRHQDHPDQRHPHGSWVRFSWWWRRLHWRRVLEITE